MDFELSDEQEAFRKVVRDFAGGRDRAARRGLGPRPRRSRSTPCSRWASSACSACPSRRSTAAAAPTSPRCASPSRSSAGSTSRWRSRVEAGVGLGANPIFQFGTEDAATARGCPTCARDGASAAFGLTEPDAGSDAGGTRTKAALDDATHEWVIDGEKAFITNSGTPITSLVTVTARTGPGRDLARSSSPPARPGSRCSRRTARWAGTRPTPTASRSTAAACPRTNLLGERGRGFAKFLAILDDGRIAIAALAVGVVAGVPRARRSRTPRSATRSASRSARTRASRSSAPTSR